MGKCKFSDTWLEKTEFRAWLRPVANNVFEAYCLVCKKVIKLGTLGVRALESHAKSEKHLTVVNGLQQTTVISQFCQVSGGSTLPRREPHCSSATPVSDLRVAFGSEPTLRAEVLWDLHTVTRHQSYNANEEIGELFQTMFPDSDIAISFRCRKDKTAALWTSRFYQERPDFESNRTVRADV